CFDFAAAMLSTNGAWVSLIFPPFALSVTAAGGEVEGRTQGRRAHSARYAEGANIVCFDLVAMNEKSRGSFLKRVLQALLNSLREGGLPMTFEEILAQVRELLEREGRVAYRILKRRFDLNEEDLEDLKADFIDAKRIAVDEEGKVLVWVGASR